MILKGWREPDFRVIWIQRWEVYNLFCMFHGITRLSQYSRKNVSSSKKGGQEAGRWCRQENIFKKLQWSRQVIMRQETKVVIVSVTSREKILRQYWLSGNKRGKKNVEKWFACLLYVRHGPVLCKISHLIGAASMLGKYRCLINLDEETQGD